MGHIRVGVLPKYTKWKDVIGLLEDTDVPVTKVADKVLTNSNNILTSEPSISSIGYCIWLLSQLTLASREDDFLDRLAYIEIDVSESTSATEFLSRIISVATKQLSDITPQNAITNIADLSLRESLTRTIGLYANTLFGTGISDVQQSLSKFSTQKRFSDLLHIYFASFLRRTLLFVLDKEMANQLGPDKRFSSIDDIEDFELAIRRFASETTRIVDEFSGGWYSKRAWQQGDISEADATRFAHVAVRKLLDDLSLNEVQ